MLVKKILISFLFLVNLSYAQDCTVGLLLPLSGEYASTGSDCQMGIDIALENNTNTDVDIKYVTGDSRAVGKDAINEFKKMSAVDKVEAALVVRSTAGMPVNPLSKNKKIPILGVVGHADFLDQNPYAFRYWPSVAQEAGALAKLAKKNKHKKVAMLTTEDDWLLSFGDSFKKDHKTFGGEIVYEETITPDYNEYKTIISKISASKPEAVFLNLGIAHLSTFIKQAREQGLTQKFYSIFWVKTQDVIDANGEEAMDGIAFVELLSDPENFATRFHKKHPEVEPSGVHYTCYTGVETLIHACKVKQETKQNFYDTLKSFESFPTVDGDIAMLNRETQYKIVAKEFAGKAVKSIH